MDDLISRQAVSSWLKQYGQDVLHRKYKFSLMYIWKNLMDLPSVQPEPKEGHWIDKGDDGDWAWQIDGRGNSWHVWGCSECGKSVFAKSSYCPHCGSYNGGERK